MLKIKVRISGGNVKIYKKYLKNGDLMYADLI